MWLRLQTALQAYDEKINQLERVRSRLRTYDDERILQRAQDQLRAAEAANQRLTELQDRLRAAQNAVEIARSKRDATDERWNSRAKKIEAATRARGEADAAARREAEARRTLEPLERLLGGARAAQEEKRRAYGEAEAILGAAEQDLRRARAERELVAMQDRRCKAADAIDAARTARAGGLAISADDVKLARLRELEKAAGEAAVRLRAVATRLDFAPDGARRITSDHGDVPPGQPLLLDRGHDTPPGALRRNHHHPGGEDLGGLRLAESAEDELRGRWRRSGVTDLSAAARAADERQKLLAEAETQERLARVHAPEGLEALDEEVRLKQAEQAALQQGAIRSAPVLEAAEADVNAASARRVAALRMFTEQKALVEGSGTAVPGGKGGLDQAPGSASRRRDAGGSQRQGIAGGQSLRSRR